MFIWLFHSGEKVNSPTGCVEFLNDIDRILTSSFNAQTAEDYRSLDGK